MAESKYGTGTLSPVICDGRSGTFFTNSDGMFWTDGHTRWRIPWEGIRAIRVDTPQSPQGQAAAHTITLIDTNDKMWVFTTDAPLSEVDALFGPVLAAFPAVEAAPPTQGPVDRPSDNRVWRQTPTGEWQYRGDDENWYFGTRTPTAPRHAKREDQPEPSQPTDWRSRTPETLPTTSTLPTGDSVSANAKTNSMAIASLILAFLIWPLGIVFGHIARHQIRRTGERGMGLTLASLIISYVWGAAVIILIVGLVAGSQPQGFNNLSTLQSSVTQQVNNEGSGTVKSTICVHNSGTQYQCLVKFTNGTDDSLSITVSSNGDRWVSND